MSAQRVESRIGWLRIRSLILLVLFMPLLGLTLVAGTSVTEYQADRRAAERLEHAATGFRRGVDFRAALGAEEVHSTVLGLALDLGVDPDSTDQVDAVRVRDDLARSRAAVDAGRAEQSTPAVASELRRLDDLRADLDAGRAGNDEVADVFRGLNQALTEQWYAELNRIDLIADEQPLSGEIRAHLRTLRHSIEAFVLAAPRTKAALDLLLETPTTERTALLLSLTERFDVASEQAAPAAGTAAEVAWTRFAEDDAAQRTESTLMLAIAVGLGQVPDWNAQFDVVAAGIEDGARWGLLLIETVGAAARDLSESAGRHARDADASVRDQTWRAGGAIALSILVGLATARTLTRPARDLQAAARRVAAGDFEAEPVPVRGPSEVRETVVAFNDMSATLAAIEDHAVALAEDPNSPVLDDPLPGRTGRALQQAIDELRTSVHQAETHRAELFELATHDSLTGLLNRVAAFTAIERDLARARRDGTQLLAFYVDLDGLKLLNDTYGHEVGDEAIVRTADVLRSTTRESDVVARLGGDEFMVVGPVPEGGREEIGAFAERVRSAVALQTVPVGDGQERPLRCSVGVALSGPGTDAAEVLVNAADEAMYRAKQTGRDRVAWLPAASDPEPTDPG